MNYKERINTKEIVKDGKNITRFLNFLIKCREKTIFLVEDPIGVVTSVCNE
jgi:hypothetical protein